MRHPCQIKKLSRKTPRGLRNGSRPPPAARRPPRKPTTREVNPNSPLPVPIPGPTRDFGQTTTNCLSRVAWNAIPEMPPTASNSPRQHAGPPPVEAGMIQSATTKGSVPSQTTKILKSHPFRTRQIHGRKPLSLDVAPRMFSPPDNTSPSQHASYKAFHRLTVLSFDRANVLSLSVPTLDFAQSQYGPV